MRLLLNTNRARNRSISSALLRSRSMHRTLRTPNQLLTSRVRRIRNLLLTSRARRTRNLLLTREVSLMVENRTAAATHGSLRNENTTARGLNPASRCTFGNALGPRVPDQTAVAGGGFLIINASRRETTTIPEAT
jgi:hypothetical protein